MSRVQGLGCLVEAAAASAHHNGAGCDFPLHLHLHWSALHLPIRRDLYIRQV